MVFGFRLMPLNHLLESFQPLKASDDFALEKCIRLGFYQAACYVHRAAFWCHETPGSFALDLQQNQVNLPVLHA